MEDLIGKSFYFISDPNEIFKIEKHDENNKCLITKSSKDNEERKITHHEIVEFLNMEIIKFK
jgi:hypothetical protein